MTAHEKNEYHVTYFSPSGRVLWTRTLKAWNRYHIEQTITDRSSKYYSRWGFTIKELAKNEKEKQRSTNVESGL